MMKCIIISDSRAHALLKDAVEEELHCCSKKPTENDKRLIYILAKTSMNQRECCSNPGSNTEKNCPNYHMLIDKVYCSRHCHVQTKQWQTTQKRMWS